MTSHPCSHLPHLMLMMVTSALPSDSANILLLPNPFRSHVTEMSSIGRGLLDAGHSLSLLLPASYPELDKLKSESGFQVIDYMVKERDFYGMEPSSDDWMDIALNTDTLQEIRTNVDGFVQLCTNPLEDDTLPDRLRGLRPDLAVVDGFPGTRCLWILAYRLGIPYVSLTTQYEPWLWRVPAVPSFVPFSFAKGGRLTERMSFADRVRNLLVLVDWTVWPRVEHVENEFVRRYLPSTDESYWTLGARSLLWLVDTDFVVDYPRPMMPNEVNVGGLSTTPAHPLTGQLEKFANSSANGLVVASFGTFDGSERFKDQFIDAFSRLGEFNIVWRYGGDISSLPPLPPNVLALNWIPQNDLLGHDNTRLFIGHCGANSQFEGIYHGVPMICLTLWGDQPYNAARMQYRGYGLDLGNMRDVTADKLVSGVRDVIGNRSYTDNVRAASDIFRSRDQTPRQRAVWWIEHVLKHGGKHLHSYGLDIPWYEYLMLDLLVVFVLLPVVCLTSLITACTCWACGRRTPVEHLKSH